MRALSKARISKFETISNFPNLKRPKLFKISDFEFRACFVLPCPTASSQPAAQLAGRRGILDLALITQIQGD